MIEFLKGLVVHHVQGHVVLDCQGVGYGVDVPSITERAIPAVGEGCQLWIYSHVREDAFRLFGFGSRVERQVFEILLSVPQVGPKVALAILSHFSVGELFGVVAEKNVKMLQDVPGIGKRSAEKILLELESKLDRLSVLAIDGGTTLLKRKGGLGQSDMFSGNSSAPSNHYEDLKSALVNLGFKDGDVTKICRGLVKDNAALSFESLLKKALVSLNQDRTIQ